MNAPSNNSGFLWKNKYHAVGDNRPCLQGDCMVNGVLYKAALWPPKSEGGSYCAKFENKAEADARKAGTADKI
jgi:hypothetical protein